MKPAALFSAIGRAMQQQDIKALIHAYRDRVREVTRELGQHFGVRPDELLFAKARREIPSAGKVVGLRFRFHGSGLWVGTSSGRAVDFDWGRYGELGGFDAWRLQQFARTNKPFKRRDIRNYDGGRIQIALNAMLDAGEIEKRAPDLGGYLYFLVGKEDL